MKLAKSWMVQRKVLRSPKSDISQGKAARPRTISRGKPCAVTIDTRTGACMGAGPTLHLLVIVSERMEDRAKPAKSNEEGAATRHGARDERTRPERQQQSSASQARFEPRTASRPGQAKLCRRPGRSPSAPSSLAPGRGRTPRVPVPLLVFGRSGSVVVRASVSGRMVAGVLFADAVVICPGHA